MNILLIEPDIFLTRTYGKALQNAGFEVFTASGAQKALSILDTKTIDLVILEPQLAGHSGIEFLYEFRSYNEWQGIPVIIHSLTPQSEQSFNQNQIDKLGIKSYLYKPETKISDLLRAIKTNQNHTVA